MGLRQRTFVSGPELLAAIDCSKPSCFVVDVHMPLMGGYELAAQLAEVAPEVPVVFITAHGDEVHRWRERSSTAVALLIKPFSEADLDDALRTSLGQHRLSTLSGRKDK